MGYLEPALLHQSSESNLGVLGRRLVRIGVLRHVLELAIQVRLKETVTVTRVSYQYGNPFCLLCQVSYYSTPRLYQKNSKILN